MALSVIHGKATVIGGTRPWFVWDRVNRCYVNAAGALRSGHAADISFATQEEAQRVADEHGKEG